MSIAKVMAELALTGVGSAILGEWREASPLAYHLRRRLSEKEQESVGPVIDVRGTAEAETRLAEVKEWLPEEFAQMENKCPVTQ